MNQAQDADEAGLKDIAVKLYTDAAELGLSMVYKILIVKFSNSIKNILIILLNPKLMSNINNIIIIIENYRYRGKG